MNPIAQGLALGYTASQILSFLSRAFPNMAPRIQKAQKAGYAAEEIVKFIEKASQGAEYPENATQYEIHKINERRDSALTKGAIKLAAGSFAIPAIARSGVGQGIMQQIGLTPKPAPTVGQPVSAQPSGVAQSAIQGNAAQPQLQAQTPLSPNIGLQSPQVPQATSPQSVPTTPQQPPTVDSKAILAQMGIEENTRNLLSKGMSPEDAGAVVDKFLKPHQKKWLDEQVKAGKAKPLVEMVKDYAAQPQQPSEQTSPVAPQSPEMASSMSEAQLEQKAKPVKGDIVATPDGIVGNLKDIKQKEALVEADGKLHKVKVDELEQPDEDIVQSVANLLKIPEIDRSSIISYWAYDPEDQQLFVQFHNGETYKYKEVPEETISALAEAMGIPKTEGKNIFGAWSPEDKKSVGATMIQQIIANEKYKKPKKGEAENPFYKQLRKGYDYWSPLRSKPKRKRQEF